MRTILILMFMAMTATASGGTSRYWYTYTYKPGHQAGAAATAAAIAYVNHYGRGTNYRSRTRSPVQSAPRPSWAKGYKVNLRRSPTVTYGSGVAEQGYVEPITIFNPYVEKPNGTGKSQSNQETSSGEQDDPEGDWPIKWNQP